MKLIIDIPEEEYMEIKRYYDNLPMYSTVEAELYYIAQGIPLPKEHGRLIDADEYKEHLYACETNGRPLYIMELDERLATVDEAPTIIEADTESEG